MNQLSHPLDQLTRTSKTNGKISSRDWKKTLTWRLQDKMRQQPFPPPNSQSWSPSCRSSSKWISSSNKTSIYWVSKSHKLRSSYPTLRLRLLMHKLNSRRKFRPLIRATNKYWNKKWKTWFCSKTSYFSRPFDATLGNRCKIYKLFIKFKKVKSHPGFLNRRRWNHQVFSTSRVRKTLNPQKF